MPSKPTPKNPKHYKNGVLNIQQSKAINEFFKNGGRQQEALLAAGYSKKTAVHCPHSVFSNPIVMAEMERRRKVMIDTAEVDEAWVLRRLARMGNSGEILAQFKKIGEDGMLYYDFTGATQEELAVIAELTVEVYIEGKGPTAQRIKKMKVGVSDPKGALDSIARILGLNKDKVTVEGELSLVDRINAGRKRAAAAT